VVSYDFIVIYSYSEFYGWLVVLTILKYTHVYVYLVGGVNHLEKYESQMGRIIPYMKWKKLLQTTNQMIFLNGIMDLW
jgi:hypothetical protein